MIDSKLMQDRCVEITNVRRVFGNVIAVKYPMATAANPTTRPIFAAIDGTRLVSIPIRTTAKMGMKYIPFIFCR